MKYIIANWKANKDLDQAKTWANDFLQLLREDPYTRHGFEHDVVTLIICPSFPFIYPLRQLFQGHCNIEIGSQNVSQFGDGTYTGEVTAHNLSSLVRYSIIGHSERSQFFHETDADIGQRLQNARQFGIIPIYCVPKIPGQLPAEPTLLCYEPPNAISAGDGRGNNISPAYVHELRTRIKLPDTIAFIYGGSVNKNNVKEYLRYQNIDGVLLGGASLDPAHLFAIINAAIATAG